MTAPPARGYVRCAADLPSTEDNRSCEAGASKACGLFDAPDAFTQLGADATDWVAFGVGAANMTRKAGGSGELPASLAGLHGSAVRTCPQSVAPKPSQGTIHSPVVAQAGVVSLSWVGGAGANGSAANSSSGVCSQQGLRLSVRVQGTAKARTLTVWAGVSAGTLSVNASLAGVAVYAEELAAAPSDNALSILRSNRWTLRLPASDTTAVLAVEFAASLPKTPPQPASRPTPAPRPPTPFLIVQAESLKSDDAKV
jgi:hypothetical protein